LNDFEQGFFKKISEKVKQNLMRTILISKTSFLINHQGNEYDKLQKISVNNAFKK